VTATALRDQRPRVSVALLGMTASLTPLAIELILPALPSVVEDLQISAGAAQWTLTAFVLGLTIGDVAPGFIQS